MKRFGFMALVLALLAPAVAVARGRSMACVDSFGTVIQGIKTPAACKKLGARWARPGTKSLPKDAANSHSAKRRRRRHRGVREASE